MSVEQLKQALKKEHCTFGANETMKKILLGRVQTIFLARDCNTEIKEKILYYKKMGKITVEELEINGAEIGALSKKQFSISIVSF